MIFDENIYTLKLQDYYGNPFTVEISGAEILAQIQKIYSSDELLDKLDKDKDV